MFSSTSLLDSAAAAARVDVRALGHEEAMALAVEWEQAKSLMEAGQSAVLAELESRGITDAVHGLRTGSWVAREAPTSPAAVRLRVRAGQTVAKHWPLVQEAWLAGELLWEHVRALLAASNPRVVEAIGGIQEPIIELAKRCGFEQWKADVASLIRLLDQDGTDPKPGDGVNRLSWKTTLDGVLDVQGTLQHDLGLVLRTAVDRRADALFRVFTRDHEQCPDIVVPGRAELCAMALIDLIRAGVGAEPGEGRARVEVTLIHHSDHYGACEHDGACGRSTTDTDHDDEDVDDRDAAARGTGPTEDSGAFDGPGTAGPTSRNDHDRERCADRTKERGTDRTDATDEDAIDEDATGEDAIDEDAIDEDAIDEDAIDEDAIDEDATDEDAIDEGSTDEGSTGEGSTGEGSTGRTDEGASDRTATSGDPRRNATANGSDSRNGRVDGQGITDRGANTRDRAGPNRTDRGDRTNRRGRETGAGRDPAARARGPGLTGLIDLEGHPIRGEQAGVWSCVAERSVLIVDRNGVPLHLGRSRRLASPGQRKALAIRDGGCTFPGCEHPAMWTDAHHVTAWEHGGRTDLDQLVSLCRRHHGVAHRQGWTLTLEADGWTRWTTPTGITITGQRHHRRPDEPDARGDTAVVVDLRDDDGGVDLGTVRDGTRHDTVGRNAPHRHDDGQHTGDDGAGRWADTG